MYLLERDIEAIKQAVKHMPGRHDQRMHGNRFGGSGSARLLVHHGGGASGHNVIRDSNGEIVGVRIRGKKPVVAPASVVTAPPAHETVKGKKLSEDEILGSDIGKAMLANDGTAPYRKVSGDNVLAGLYAHQGFDGKPDLVSEDDLMAAIRGGEREFYRAVNDTGNGDYTKAFQSGTNYAGYGIYGNGTYMAYSVDPKLPLKGLKEAFDYGDTAMHISLKSDANIGDYSQIKRETTALATTTESEVQSLQRSYNRTRNPAKKLAVGEQLDKKKALLEIYKDEGRYAASQGYDGYDVSASGTRTGGVYNDAGYFVLLNRTAIRVSTVTTKR